MIAIYKEAPKTPRRARLKEPALAAHWQENPALAAVQAALDTHPATNDRERYILSRVQKVILAELSISESDAKITAILNRDLTAPQVDQAFRAELTNEEFAQYLECATFDTVEHDADGTPQYYWLYADRDRVYTPEEIGREIMREYVLTSPQETPMFMQAVRRASGWGLRYCDDNGVGHQPMGRDPEEHQCIYDAMAAHGLDEARHVPFDDLGPSAKRQVLDRLATCEDYAASYHARQKELAAEAEEA